MTDFSYMTTLKKQIDQMRPIDEHLYATIYERLKIEWTYHSNAIEGNTLTLGETLFFLRDRLTSEGRPLQDYLEAKNHAQAIDILYDFVQNQQPITEHMIKELHALLMHGIDFTSAKGLNGQIIQKKIHAGQYKTQPNHVLTLSGNIHKYTDPLHVHDNIQALLSWYEQSANQHPIERASEFHYRFVCIHPFDDGNGRLARLFMNLILMQCGYPPCIIKHEHRRQYLSALEIADTSGCTDTLIAFISKSLIATFEMILTTLNDHGTQPTPLHIESASTANYYLSREQRENKIISCLANAPASIGKLHASMPQIKRPTLKKDLQRLLHEGRIQRQGKGKGCVYFLQGGSH